MKHQILKKKKKENPLLKLQGERWRGNSDYGGWEGTVTTSLQNEISGKLTSVCLEGKYFKPKSFPANIILKCKNNLFLKQSKEQRLIFFKNCSALSI